MADTSNGVYGGQIVEKSRRWLCTKTGGLYKNWKKEYADKVDILICPTCGNDLEKKECVIFPDDKYDKGYYYLCKYIKKTKAIINFKEN